MHTIEFLSAVLPTSGSYCAFTMSGGTKRNIFVESVESLQQTIEQLDARGKSVWFALAAFDADGRRQALHAHSIRSIFMDLDCGIDSKTGKSKAFASKRDAVVRLDAFLKTIGLDTLGDPWLVDSGGGVHAYWPLDDDAEIADWKPVVASLKNVAAEHHFPMDATVTSDAARVLRMPGTHNFKYDPPRPVRLVKQGTTFALADIAAMLPPVVLPPQKSELALLGPRPVAIQKAMSSIAAAMAGNSVTYFKKIMIRTVRGTGCSQLAYYVDNAAQDGMEPLWRGMLSLTSVCADGVKAAIKLSSLHPYDAERMQQKLRDIKGPYTCATLDATNPGICKTCPNYRKISTPLLLGRELVQDTEEKTFSTGNTTEPLVRPAPPAGFFYGAEGGVFTTVKATKKGDEDIELMLTNYDLFMTRMFRDGTDCMAEFVSVKGSLQQTFGIPVGVVTSMADTLRTLAAYNVIAVKGTWADPHLYRYVRACVTEASMTGKEVPVPPRLGWQPDNSFAVGDTLYSAQGPEHDYTYKSERLHNVIETTRPAGTLAEWQSVIYMLRDKAVSTPRLWGHVGVSLLGMATALMKFGPSGARASTVHIAGSTSGAGKTLAMRLANSVWGNPTNYTVQPSTSERTMMQRAGLLGSLHLAVDEVTEKTRTSQGEWLYKYLYDFAAGSHKLKGSASGNAEIAHECVWESLSVISSNAPVLEAMMGARESTSHGEVKRFLEWKLPQGWEIEWEPHERELLSLLDNNYGCVGREWAKWLVLNHDTAKRVWNETAEHWRQVSKANDTERFWSTAAVSLVAAAILAGPKHANLLNIPVSPLLGHWLAVVNSMRRVINSNKRNALDILHAYTREFASNLVHVRGDTVFSHLGMSAHSSIKGAVRGRVEFDVSPGMIDYYIEVKMLKIHCARLNHSFTEFQTELKNLATVSEHRRDLLSGTTGPSMRVACLKISCPTETAEDAGLLK